MLGTMLVGLIVPRDPFFTFHDYVTPEEASALVAATPSYQVRMVMRIMLWTGLRVAGYLSVRPAGLRPYQDPPILGISRQWVSKSMEEEAAAAGIDPSGD